MSAALAAPTVASTRTAATAANDVFIASRSLAIFVGSTPNQFGSKVYSFRDVTCVFLAPQSGRKMIQPPSQTAPPNLFLRLDMRRLGHGGPFLDLAVDQGCEFGRCIADALGAIIGEPRLHLWRAQSFRDLGLQQVDDQRRRAGRCEHAE